jgi:hypothetical protein
MMWSTKEECGFRATTIPIREFMRRLIDDIDNRDSTSSHLYPQAVVLRLHHLYLGAPEKREDLTTCPIPALLELWKKSSASEIKANLIYSMAIFCPQFWTRMTPWAGLRRG